MLKEFKFNNFLSFKDTITFTMEADSSTVSEFPDHIVNFKDEGILKVASFYGPNGSGKSNFLKVFSYFKQLVLNGMPKLNRYLDLEMSIKNMDYTNFHFCEDKNNVISFTSFFINEFYEVGYELEIEKQKDEKIIVKSENMSYRNLDSDIFESLYERSYNEIIFDYKIIDLLHVKSINISDQITLLSFINKLYLNESNVNPGVFEVLKFLVVEIDKISYINSLRVPFRSSISLNSYKDEKMKKHSLSILKKLGFNFTNIIVETSDDYRPKVYTVRTVNGITYNHDIKNESDGTLELLSLLPRIIKKIETGGILIIDEIDAHLHPKLTKTIIEIFTNINNTKAQLIFTSHDILNMTNELFRRDEIWFVVKDDETFSSNLIALTDFVNYKGEKVRKDAKYSKQYLEGKYGADPFISKGVYWNGKDS